MYLSRNERQELSVLSKDKFGKENYWNNTLVKKQLLPLFTFEDIKNYIVNYVPVEAKSKFKLNRKARRRLAKKRRAKNS